MQFGSVCSGIEAASVAWHPLGWRAAWVSEIEPFPCAVLAHHYPGVANLGDMTTLPARILSGEISAPDIFCGGTPCQAFSVAGLRRSLDDARGNLSLVFCEIANAIDAARRERGILPSVIFWENVPGVLSTTDNAYGCFLAGLAGESEPVVAPGGRWTDAGCVFGPERAVAWRVLDAQHFNLAQRRKRVFVVASARDGFDPAAVLFEFEGVRRDSAPSREAGQGAARGAAAGAEVGQPYTVGDTLTARMHKGSNTTLDEGQTPVLAQPYTLAVRGRGDSHQLKYRQDGTANALLTPNGGRAGIGVGAIAFNARQDPDCWQDRTGPLDTSGFTQAVGTDCYNGQITGDIAATMGTPGSSVNASGPTVMQSMQVRRLTPVECERLQGFPDGYTNIPWRGKPESPDGPRYKALGNSWAVPVVRWIGARIQHEIIGDLA